MANAVEHLLSILDLEPLEHNLFRGRSPQDGWQRVFGSQVIGQALVAASRTVENRAAHSLHAYFMRPGDPKEPTIYKVERIRDGRSYTTRRIVAIQHGQAIFSMSASFHLEESGFEHQIAMPDVPPPEELPSEAELAHTLKKKLPEAMRAYWERDRPIEVRPIDISRFDAPEPATPNQTVWMRATDRMPDDVALHQCSLAYASDFLAAGYRIDRPWPLAFRPQIDASKPRSRPLVPSAVPGPTIGFSTPKTAPRLSAGVASVAAIFFGATAFSSRRSPKRA